MEDDIWQEGDEDKEYLTDGPDFNLYGGKEKKKQNNKYTYGMLALIVAGIALGLFFNYGSQKITGSVVDKLGCIESTEYQYNESIESYNVSVSDCDKIDECKCLDTLTEEKECERCTCTRITKTRKPIQVENCLTK